MIEVMRESRGVFWYLLNPVFIVSLSHSVMSETIHQGFRKEI